MGERRRREAAALATMRGMTMEEVMKLPREEVYRLIAEAGIPVMDRGEIKGAHVLPPGGEFDVASVEIAQRGAPLSVAAEAADLTARILAESPRILISLTIGGYEEDERELMDIPDALTYFAAYGQRLQDIDRATSPPGAPAVLLFAHDQLSQMLMLVGLGIVPRSKVHLNLRTWDDPANSVQFAADMERAREAAARRMAAEAAEAKGAPKQ